MEQSKGNNIIEMNLNKEIISNNVQPVSKKMLKKMKKQMLWESKKKEIKISKKVL